MIEKIKIGYHIRNDIRVESSWYKTSICEFTHQQVNSHLNSVVGFFFLKLSIKEIKSDEKEKLVTNTFELSYFIFELWTCDGSRCCK